jgi:hypothetical protein
MWRPSITANENRTTYYQYVAFMVDARLALTRAASEDRN